MTEPLLTERVSSIPVHMRERAKFYKQLKQSANDRQNNCNSIEALINKINKATDYQNVPDRVSFGYNSLEQRGIPVKDVVDIVNTANFLAANRLGASLKPITFFGFATNPISNKFFNDLKNNGFQGGMVSSVNHSHEEVRETYFAWEKDHSRWHPDILPTDRSIIVSEPKPIQIELTFRQQQVLHFIKNRGLTNARIAKELGISEQAVKQHTSLILKKYGVQSRTQLVLAAGDGMKA
jgi:DNA-binding CsgD family transcriptional regulator